MNRAFTLVELSIVLVILGLLTGGILAGQSLIRAAELRSVSTEYQRHITAAQTFRDKYFAIAGDMNNATRFWNRQVAAAHCVTNSSAAVSTPGTCDGGGDGIIFSSLAANQSGERFQFWRQLAHAGLTEGSYTGLSGTTNAEAHISGVNCAASRLPNGGWSVFTHGTNAGAAGSSFAGSYGTTLVINTWNDSLGTAVLRPEEAWNLDTKMDDGRPGRGKIMAVFISTCTDAGSGAGSQNDLDADYLLTSSAIGCGLFFTNIF